MLSNTKGYSRYARALGSHRDELSRLRHVCPALRNAGRCKPYLKEQELRRTIAAAKEAELLKKATALYTAQMDLAADLAGEDGDAELLAELSAQVGFSTDPSKSADIIGKLLAELKQEPAYLNWSLDAAVAERMVELRVRPCRYTHREDVAVALKRSRSEHDRAEAQAMQQHAQEQKEVLKSTNAFAGEEEKDGGEDAEEGDEEGQPSAATSTATAEAALTGSNGRRMRNALLRARAWTEERHRIFNSLTPLQRCVVCLLWQRVYRVEQAVVCDVRLLLERRLTDVYDRTGSVAVDGVVVASRATASAAQPPQNKKGRQESEEGEDEDALDAFLSSAAFEELVERESKRIVTRVAFRPEFGLVDLSALPLLVAHLSTHPDAGVILGRTLTHFTGRKLPSRTVKEATTAAADIPAPASFHSLLFPTRRAMTEKEMDLSGVARADEVMEAIEWTLRVVQREAEQRAASPTAGKADTSSSPLTTAAASSSAVSALFRQSRVRLHGLTMTHCKITAAEDLVAALRKRGLDDFLYALDLSDNRLWSMRFLLVLRAHFTHRLLRLSLKGNPITRKPEYQEQVRLSLPQLTSLDGEPIRRPPLRLPKPLPASCTRVGAEGSSTPEAQAEQAAVLDTVNRLLYIWETHRIPYTAGELTAFTEQGLYQDDGSAAHMRDEEDWNEDNFPHRYLHPAATFSVAMSPGLNFFDPATMQDARAVEESVDYSGMRLSPIDVRDARVFDVAMKNSSRNLLTGRPALQRFGKGADLCYQAYQLTLYPERMDVAHHVTDTVVAVARMADVAAVRVPLQAAQAGKKAKASAAATTTAVQFGSQGRRPNPTQHVVTLHGVMTWRLPSMKGGECMRAAYTRALVLVKKVLPAQNREWERLRSPPYVVLNDQLFLYPAPSPLLQPMEAPCAIFRANTAARLARLVVEFGLEACRDGVALVRDVMERCTSPASEYAALQALVLGVLGPRDTPDGSHGGDATTTAAAAAAVNATATLGGEDAATVLVAREAEARLAPVMNAFVNAAAAAVLAAGTATSAAARTYGVFSILEGPAAATGETFNVVGEVKSAAGGQKAKQHQSSAKKTKKARTAAAGAAAAAGETAGKMEATDTVTQSAVQTWAAGLHTITLPLLHDVTAITNAVYTCL